MTAITFNRTLATFVGKELHSDLTNLRAHLNQSKVWDDNVKQGIDKLARISKTACLRGVYKALHALHQAASKLEGQPAHHVLGGRAVPNESGNEAMSLDESAQKMWSSVLAHLNEMVHDHKNAPLKMAKPLHALESQLGNTPSPVMNAELYMPYTPEDASPARPSELPISEFSNAIRDYRSAYQTGVIKLLRENDDSQFAVLRQALVSIEPKNPLVGYRLFFEAAIAILDILKKSKTLDNFSRWVLSKVDLELNHIAEGSVKVNDDLLSCMLYLVARADPDVSVRVRKLQEHFNLKSYLADIHGVDQAVIDKFSQYLVRTREVWSQVAAQDPIRVEKLIAELQRQSSLLKNDGFSLVIKALHEVIDEIAKGKAQVDGEQLSLEGASALLILEQQLRDGSNMYSANLSANRLYQLIGRAAQANTSANEPQASTAILHVLASEIQEDLTQLEPRLLDWLNGQTDGEEELRIGLKKISRILSVFGKNNNLVQAFSHFESSLHRPRTLEEQTEIATWFAQLNSLMESLKVSDKIATAGAQKWLNAVTLRQQELGNIEAPVTPPAASSEYKDVANDAEMLEIFLEEAHTVVRDQQRWLSQLEVDPSMHETLVNIRRGFHTLKGSGRMVGLTRFGDMAYIGELLLNNWITDKKIPSVELLDYVRQLIMSLQEKLDHLQKQGHTLVDYDEFEQRSLALGGTPLSNAPQTRRTARFNVPSKASSTPAAELPAPDFDTPVEMPSLELPASEKPPVDLPDFEPLVIHEPAQLPTMHFDPEVPQVPAATSLTPVPLSEDVVDEIPALVLEVPVDPPVSLSDEDAMEQMLHEEPKLPDGGFTLPPPVVRDTPVEHYELPAFSPPPVASYEPEPEPAPSPAPAPEIPAFHLPPVHVEPPTPPVLKMPDFPEMAPPQEAPAFRLPEPVAPPPVVPSDLVMPAIQPPPPAPAPVAPPALAPYVLSEDTRQKAPLPAAKPAAPAAPTIKRKTPDAWSGDARPAAKKGPAKKAGSSGAAAKTGPGRGSKMEPPKEGLFAKIQAWLQGLFQKK